jgi:lipoyl(octanoyl) transferase
VSAVRSPGWHVAWGLRSHGELSAFQQRVIAARAQSRIPNVLLTGEHPAVITLGRRTPAGFGERGAIPVVEVERGGEATYHGPGQIVAYPIVHLTEARRDLHRFQRDLEEIGIRVCADAGASARRVEGKTGVWIGDHKVMSLGIAVRRWVTWHGLALNVTTDLSPFRLFNPCGLEPDVMTTLAAEVGHDLAMDHVRDRLVHHAGELLPGGPFEPRTWDDLQAAIA